MRAFAASQPAAQAVVGPRLLSAPRKEAEQQGAEGATASAARVRRIPKTLSHERIPLVAVTKLQQLQKVAAPTLVHAYLFTRFNQEALRHENKQTKVRTT